MNELILDTYICTFDKISLNGTTYIVKIHILHTVANKLHVYLHTTLNELQVYLYTNESCCV